MRVNFVYWYFLHQLKQGTIWDNYANRNFKENNLIGVVPGSGNKHIKNSPPNKNKWVNMSKETFYTTRIHV